jgi:beta-lactamase class A
VARAGLTRFVRSLDDTITWIGRFGPESKQSNDVLDTTTPQAIAGSVRKIILGVLSGKTRQLLEGWMIAAKPGLKRLRAAFPADWVGADRPGTNLDHETKDYALAKPPRRAPLLVAAYYDALPLNTDVSRSGFA